MQNCSILWFSGTGNTLWAAQMLASKLLAQGIKVELAGISSAPNWRPAPGNTLIFCWPVYSYGMPRLMNRFVSALPAGNNPVYLLCTMGGGAGGALAVAGGLFLAKGYDVKGGIKILMPNNYIAGRKPDPASIGRLLDSAQQKVEDYAWGISRQRLYPLADSRISMLLSRAANRAFYLGLAFSSKLFSVSKDRCNGCGICARICPVKNISFSEYPRWGKACEQCLRCYHSCPQAAIDFLGAKRGRPQYLVPGFHTMVKEFPE